MAYEPRGDHGDRGGGQGQDGSYMKVRGRSESMFALQATLWIEILQFGNHSASDIHLTTS